MSVGQSIKAPNEREEAVVTRDARPGWLVLADGTRFAGHLFGAEQPTVGEAVFTTGMTGYQEVLTDPSYCGQLVTMTAPHIGNTGINPEDAEAHRPALSGFVVHALAPMVSNWRSRASLNELLLQHGIAGISGVDTRALTRHIRMHGAQMGAIGGGNPDDLCERARGAPSMVGRNLTQEVSTATAYRFEGALDAAWDGRALRPSHGMRVVAVDFGVKRNMLRCLVDAGFDVTVVPANSRPEDILGYDPDAVFLSNGPGDPAAVEAGIATVRGLLGKKPMFAICLGHQLVCRALGAETFKLKFGHRGMNQPVQDLATRKVEITSQNHGFAVDLDSLRGATKLTHIHLNDGTCEGIENIEAKVFSVQYHPEAGGGPHDARYLFDRFVERAQHWR